MRYVVLATDYDGTLAPRGTVDEVSREALVRCRESGRKLVLVTGRELPELAEVFPQLELFDYIVAENGALLYKPSGREEKPLTEPPPEALARMLAERGVQPLSVGKSIIATREPYDTVALECIRDLGVEFQVIFNKGAVMLVPSGVNKASGLKAALLELGLSPHNTVAVGDAENDHALLDAAECAVAVANSVPQLLKRADVVVGDAKRHAVVHLIDWLLENDLADVAPQLARHNVLLGKTADSDVSLPAHGKNVLVAGTSGAGKSTLAAGFLERVAEREYQICVVDPEGDHDSAFDALTVGSGSQAPDVDQVLHALENPQHNVVVNLHGIPLQERPTFFMGLLGRLTDLRSRTGRPHWIVVDEAHHVLPSSWEPSALPLPDHLHNVLYITLEECDLVAAAALQGVETVITVGEKPALTYERFGQAVGLEIAAPPGPKLERGEALLWSRTDARFVRFDVEPGTQERRRHNRKYAEGDVGEDRSFYFRGPEDKLKLRAQNLITFLQIAEGVDDETWLHHLKQGDYSSWFTNIIKDPALGEAAQSVEESLVESAEESRAAIKQVIEEHYTLPGGPATPIKAAED
jgi:HAD superfamily hydrolase (TIGR01484 family)